MAEQRNANGRFSPGWKGGPGRPSRNVESVYLTKLSETCTPKRWSKIVERAVADAETGNAKAREWLGGYLMGRPLHGLDVSFGYMPETEEEVIEELMTLLGETPRSEAQTKSKTRRGVTRKKGISKKS